MARGRKKAEATGELTLENTLKNYRHQGAKRKNNPPAKNAPVGATSPSLSAQNSGEDAATTSPSLDFENSGEEAATTSPSLSAQNSGEDAATTDKDFGNTWLDYSQPIGHVLSGRLPHWRQDGVMYWVTWRTDDSMPKERVSQWAAEREAWLKQHPRPHNAKAMAEYDRLFTARWERWLDECHGECLLRQETPRHIVENALHHFDGQRYRLHNFVVAPNHVHVLVTPLENHELSDILQNWKSFTAHEINKQLHRKGTFWEKNNFDHIVRNAADQERIEAYIDAHVVAASPPLSGLEQRPVVAASPPLSGLERRPVVAASPPLSGEKVVAASPPLGSKNSGGDAATTFDGAPEALETFTKDE